MTVKLPSTALLAATVAAGRIGVRLVAQRAEDIEARAKRLQAAQQELQRRIDAEKARAQPAIAAAAAKRARRRSRNIANEQKRGQS